MVSPARSSACSSRRSSHRAHRGLPGICSSGGIRAPSIVPLARDRPEITRFVIQSGIGTSLVSMRNTLAPLALGIVASPTQVGYFRAAQAPITGLEALSAPVRLILLTEQTRDFEHGQVAQTYATLRRYVVGASVVAVALVPVFWIAMPWLIELVLPEVHGRHGCRADPAARSLPSARAGLDEDVPGLDRPARPADRRARRRDRRAAPAPAPLRQPSGARPAQPLAMLVATIAFGLTWAVLLVRLRREPLPVRAPEGDDRVRVLIVSGIWPPDVGGPASHAPAVARLPRRPRARRSRWWSRPTCSRSRGATPCAGRPRRLPVGLRHLHSLVLIARRARRADVVYTTGMFGRSGDRRPAHADAVSSSSSRATPRSSGCARAEPSAATSRRSRTAAVVSAARALRRPARRRPAACGPRLHAERLPRATSRSRWGAPPDRVSVLPNPGPAELPTSPREELRRRLGLDGPTLAFAGRLTAQKSLDVLRAGARGVRGRVARDRR